MPRWETIAVKGRLEALFIQSLLQGEGILVRLKGEATGNVYIFNTGPMGQVEIQVPANQITQARELLKAAAEGENGGGG
ncbi:MAG: DUF2007 domain-containing protein [Clostridia bacterium]|nr:DUF2007 domain-containing protein [Clostridia bacterium]